MPLDSRFFERTLEFVRDAVSILECSPNEAPPRIVYANRAFEEMAGYQRTEVVGREPCLLQGERTDSALRKALAAALAAGERFEGESWHYRKNGEPFLLRMSVEPLPDDSGAVTHLLLRQSDITDRRRLHRRRQDLERIVNLQREVVRGGLDLQRVRQRVVDAVLRVSDADAAVVEEAQGDEMVYMAVAGLAEGALGLRLPIEGSLTGLSFRSRKTIRTDDTRQDPRVHQEAARKVGFVSGVLVPLIHDQRCYGVVKVYASRPSAFCSDDVHMLELASGILGAALFNAASFEQEVERRSRLVDAIPILVSFIDTERRLREINAAYEDWFGVKACDIRGKYLWEVLGEEAYERIRPYVDAAMDGEEVSYEADIPYKKGGERAVIAQYQPSFGHDGDVSGIYAVVRDLTAVKQAEQDFLTGLWNRRKIEERAGQMLQSAAGHDQATSLMLLDIDHFKRINDRFGHPFGDAVIKGVAGHLDATVRGLDMVGRWGGEEFIICLPGTGLEEARMLGERIRTEMRRISFDALDSVTISIGVAQAEEDESFERLVERADSALYRAKREGRDRVVVA